MWQFHAVLFYFMDLSHQQIYPVEGLEVKPFTFISIISKGVEKCYCQIDENGQIERYTSPE